MAIKMQTENITPERAAHYLNQNTANYRKISRAKAALYAEEMKAGKWQLNGEGIVFDETGKLKNGQHRLAAIIMAGIPVQMTVITGVSDEVTIYDSGMTRSTKQIAQASGCGDISATEAAVATWIVGDFNNKVPKGMVLDWLKGNYPEISRAYRLCGASNHKNLSNRAGCVLGAFMAMTLDEIKSYELETFFRVFNSGNVIGTDGYEPSSALVARRMFEERYKAMPIDKRRIMEQVEILTMALRDFKAGKTRQMNYQIKEPLACVEKMHRLRRQVGLEEE